MRIIDNVFIGNTIIYDSNFLSDIINQPRIVIVTDTNVATLYLDNIVALLPKDSVDILILEAGESNKDWAAIEKIFAFLDLQKHDRFSIIVSLGGGVVGDLTGFAASVFMRGIPWVQIPTTLIAQVDAAIGGKTGCNYLGVKNLIGTFYQPKAVLIDIAMLQSLPEREYRSGLAEVVKYGMACDANFFMWLQEHAKLLKQRDAIILQDAISKCCELKLNLVRKDLYDNAERRALNFGHTFAHALEAATNFEVYLHGEAVAIGMLLATRLAVKLQLVDQKIFDCLSNLLEYLGLPLQWDPAQCCFSTLHNYMMFDKKKRAEQLCLILPCSMGKVSVVNGVDIPCLEGLIEEYADSWNNNF